MVLLRPNDCLTAIVAPGRSPFNVTILREILQGAAMALVALAVLAMAIVSGGCGAPSQSLVVSFEDLQCASCGDRVAAKLERTEGVRSATFDRMSAELTAEYDPDATSADVLLTAVDDSGFPFQRGAGKGSYAREVTFTEAMDAVQISTAGEEVDIEAHLVAGKVTVVDFFALWCGPCREVARTLRSILETSSDVAVRQVNIVDWDRPVVRQHLSGISQLPHVRVFDGSGKLVDTITGLDVDRLRAAIQTARNP